jgi:hypothetical protein
MTGPDDPDDPLGRGSRLNPIKNPDSLAGQLAQALRDLVDGEPLRQFAARVPCALATLSDALSGDPRKVPGPRIVEGICKVRGVDEKTLARLLDMRAKANKTKPFESGNLDPPHSGLDGGDPPRPNAGIREQANLEPNERVRDRPRTWLAARRRSVAAGLVALLSLSVIAAAVIIIRQGFCGDGVRRVGDQCIGVTDGRVVLGADLAGVLDKIREEDGWVDRSGQDAVSIAYLVSLPTPSSNDELAVLLRHELEGAYIAQWEANHTKILGR